MVDRLLFYWIDRARADLAVDQAIESSTFVDPRSAPASPTLRDNASSLTGQTTNLSVFKLIVQTGFLPHKFILTLTG